MRNQKLASDAASTAADENAPMLAVASKPRVTHPKLLLTLFSVINFISYYDRGAISGSLSTIKSDPGIAGGAEDLSDTKSGAIVSAFMVGFMVFSPIFAALGGVLRPSFIVAAGLFGWCIACFMTSMARSYPMLILARSLVGVGEAAFCGFIPTMIDDFAPPDKRTMFIGAYFAMVPVGTAVGMVGGGLLSNFNQGTNGTDEHTPVKGWQFTFFVQCWVMLPIIAMCMRLPAHLGTGAVRPTPVENADNEDGNCSKTNSPKSQENAPLITATPDDTAQAPAVVDEEMVYPNAWEAAKLLASNGVFIFTVLGYALYTFVLGGIAAWGIVYMEQGALEVSTGVASVSFGLSTAVTGIIGTIIGGWFVDYKGGSKGASGMAACTKFNICVTLLSVPCGIVAFMIESLPLFLLLVAAAEVLLFASTAPVNATVLESVGTQMRTYSMAVSTFIIHALGDVLSPILVGAVSDSFNKGCPLHDTESLCVADVESHCKWVPRDDGNEKGTCRNDVQLRNAMLFVFMMLLLAPAFWAVGLIFCRRLQKKQEETDVEDYSSQTQNREGDAASLRTIQ